MRAPSTTIAGHATWDPEFATRSPWLEVAGLVAGELRDGPDHPSLDTLTRLAEARRARVAPDLAPVRFVEQGPKARRRAKGPVDPDAQYDVRIARHGEVPSRPANAHDFWNAIAWMLFPRTKRAIHARQCRALLASIPSNAKTLPNVRTRERDALTILDEGGAIVVATHAAAAAITRGPFEEALSRALEAGDARLVVLGHAVLEHFQRSSPPVLALAHVVAVGDALPADPLDAIDEADRVLARDVDDPGSFRAPDGPGSVRLHADGRAEPIARRAVPATDSADAR